MTVLIDTAMWPAHGTLWAHLVSDASLDELHAFAAANDSRAAASTSTTTTCPSAGSPTWSPQARLR